MAAASPYMSHFLTNKSIFYRGDPMANRKNSHRRRVRVAVLMVLCGAVFAAFFAQLAWMQFVRADYRGRSGPRHHRV